MPTALISEALIEEDPDVLFGRALVECWVGRSFVDDEDFRLARKRFYTAANAGQIPVTKRRGLGWVGRRSLIKQHRRELLDQVDREARARVGMAPAA